MKTSFKMISFLALTLASLTFAAPKSAPEYYSDAAFQYIENRLPTAEITCKEGLSFYPDDAKLQMLLDRINEAKNEQKNQNKQNNQDKNKNQDQNKDQQNKDQDKNKNQDQNQDQNQNQNQNRNSSSSGNGQNQGLSSSSNNSGNSGEGNSQGNENSSNSQGGEEPEQTPPGQMNKDEASQLLKDFDEEHGERKPWKPVKGMVRPEKDW